MRHRTTITSALVSAAVVLVLVGTPGAAAATPSEMLQQHGFACSNGIG